MELVKSAWVIIFLLFALTLLLVWSKTYIISRKIKSIDALISQSEAVNGTPAGEAGNKTAS
ncbi:MAG: hypothetical protein JXA18_13680 [Chitinispirillaceae bacterium]|nr:hypothetical protein [Chitinispirillaceae bacterium]